MVRVSMLSPGQNQGQKQIEWNLAEAYEQKTQCTQISTFIIKLMLDNNIESMFTISPVLSFFPRRWVIYY